ncbi:MAG TPA: hypothetical protein ENN13_02230 [Candidatus Altiarchaeales archaeon]|nr:hypothetical protein [Candidatus Altiarchaeales archaeon]
MDTRTTIQVTEDLRRELKVLAAARDEPYQKVLEDMVEVFKELDRDKTIISIPAKLAEKVQKNISKTDFETLSDYVTFLLRVMLYEKGDDAGQDVEKIRERLKKLGYLE